MPFRRSHHKSRNGCLTCKKRRVKCDETGPPCGNCRARSAECRYTGLEAPVQTSPTNGTVAPAATSSGFDSGAAFTSQNPCFPISRQTLELQLMHRWSVATFQSLVSHLIKDDDVWQLAIPNLAFTNEFLLNGILAFSAFDIACGGGPAVSQYINAAFEYQGVAIKGYQNQLYNVNENNREALFYFSTLLMALSIVSVQFQATHGERDRMIQNTATHFELVRGAGVILMKNLHIIDSNPLLREIKALEELDKTPVVPKIQGCIDKLCQLNNDRNSTRCSILDCDRVKTMQYKIACEKAIFWLQECFEKCTKPENACYSIMWPSLAGEEYIKAIKEKDTIALLILMYWGILADKLGQDYWWGRDFGKSLIAEIARIVLADTNETMVELALIAQEQIQSNVHNDAEHLQG